MSTRPQSPTSDLTVESWPIAKLRPYKRNPRRHDEPSVAKIAASISEFGFKVPLLVTPKGKLIAGHGRYEAAKRLGMSEVAVIVCRDLSALQAKALRLADNRTAEESSWDYELLGAEIQALLASDYDIDVLGFDDEELAALLAQPTVGLNDPDAVPEPPDEPITQPGDLWILGGHRLLCGDATHARDVARLMDGARANLLATDPPYLVGYDGGNHPPTWANGGKKPGAPSDAGTKHWDTYVDHDTSVAFYENFLRAATEGALSKTPIIYMFFGMMRAPIVFEAWERAGLLLHQVLIWHKSRVVLSRSDYCWTYEPIAYGWVKGRRPRSERRPPANALAVWDVPSAIEDGSQAHPTCKPAEVVRRPIEYHTKPGELVFEPFCGSGTAIIAAEMTGRSCRALELSPAFCDVAVQRWERFTGRKAVRDGALD